ncbi:MAG: putative glycosyl transferase [Ilumatobacteraceae bacterium]|nr:putative glycosyl transferase [Ilumatobacteraceae bacterium]
MTVINRPSLRVLLITDCADMYGTERWNVQLIRGLQTRGHHVAIAQPQADNDVTHEIAAAGVRQYWLTPPVAGIPWRTFVPDGPSSTDHAEARAILTDARPDVIVFSDGEPGSNLPAKEVARDFDIPSITVAHLGNDVEAKERTFTPGVLDRIGSAMRHARAVVGVSPTTLASLVGAFGLDPSRTHAIPNGRPAHFFEPIDPDLRAASRAALGITDEHVLFLTLARPHRNKQYSIQIDALRRLHAGGAVHTARFVWAGDGPSLGRLRALVRLSRLSDVVTISGYVPDPSALLGAADAFVLPSSREGMPLAIVEAMGAGLAVIATDVGGVADLMGDTGILLPDPNLDRAATVDELHGWIIRVASDAELRRRLGAAARTRASAHFREDHMIERYEVLLRTAAMGTAAMGTAAMGTAAVGAVETS